LAAKISNTGNIKSNSRFSVALCDPESYRDSVAPVQLRNKNLH